MASAKFQIERKCEICGKSFIAKTLTSKYCSKNCSQAAYKQRKKEEQLDALKREKAARVPKNQPYLSIADATALFDIDRDSLFFGTFDHSSCLYKHHMRSMSLHSNI